MRFAIFNWEQNYKMFNSRKQKLNKYIGELNEYMCVLCDHTRKVDEIIKRQGMYNGKCI